MTDTTERELGWDDEIEKDGADFITLPEGEYDFEVTNFERERYAGGEKLPACNKAVIEIRLDGGTLGSTTIRENLFLHSITEGILCAFFTSIGQRQHGEKLKPNWGTVVGSKGRAKVAIRKYTKKLDDGSTEERTINQVKRWIEPAGAKASAASDKPAGYTPGAF
jgi:hypothetical protein